MSATTTTIEVEDSLNKVVRRELKNAKNEQKKSEVGGNEHDPRLPTGLGDWKCSIPYKDEYFAMDKHDEPHNKRKRDMLKKYPQIRNLYGYTNLTILYTIFVITIQFITSYYVNFINPFFMVILAYVIGGTVGSICGIVLHECTHNLAGKYPFINTICGYLANSVLVVPVYVSFRRHHLDHHAFQGVINKDPDLPISWEIPLVKGNTFAKCIWLFFFPACYAIRGLYVGKPITIREIENWAVMIAIDLAVYYYFGWYSLLYLLISTWFSFGIHPAATHFIQEHYTFDDGQETYSYYGSGNYLFLNIGYHNEHHDFAHIPWTRLPQLRELAKPYYASLRHHTSWFSVIYQFLTKSSFGPQSRIVRDFDVHQSARHRL